MTEDESQYAVEYEEMFAIKTLDKQIGDRNKFTRGYRSDDEEILSSDAIGRLLL